MIRHVAELSAKTLTKPQRHPQKLMGMVEEGCPCRCTRAYGSAEEQRKQRHWNNGSGEGVHHTSRSNLEFIVYQHLGSECWLKLALEFAVFVANTPSSKSMAAAVGEVEWTGGRSV